MNKKSIPSEFMVRVQCMTYNHAPYIEDAMNGFCMQETDFPFVCVIVDDASTDGEQEVIKRYLNNNFDLQNDQFFREEDTDDYHLIFARHKTNRNCYFGVLFLKYNHYHKKDKNPYYEKWSKAKYIAICEGDDYWIYPRKLQMQVDALEKHQECSFCSCGFRIANNGENEKDMTIPCNDLEVVYGIDAWMKLWVTKTLTLLIRKEVYYNFLAIKSRYAQPKDTHLQYHLFKEGMCLYLSLCMGVYHNTGQGVWNSKSKEEQLELSYITLRDLYLKNKQDIIVYGHYFNLLKLYLMCRYTKSFKFKLFVEGVRNARNGKDRMNIIKEYYRYIKDYNWR